MFMPTPGTESDTNEEAQEAQEAQEEEKEEKDEAEPINRAVKSVRFPECVFGWRDANASHHRTVRYAHVRQAIESAVATLPVDAPDAKLRLREHCSRIHAFTHSRIHVFTYSRTQTRTYTVDFSPV